MRIRRSVRFTDWPAADRSAWDAALAEGDVFDGRGPAAHWSAGSRESVIAGYSRWLGWLSSSAPELLDQDPWDRPNPQRVRYIGILEAQVASVTTASYVRHLYDALRVMAPEREWTWLRRIKAGLELRMRSGSKRHRLVDADRLLGLGLDLMDQADLPDGHLVGPIQYRDGLLIALLACRPIRRRNLAAMRIDRHLQKIGDRYHLCFEGSQTKNRQPLEYRLPDVLTPYLDRYLATIRPGFPGAHDHDLVWVSAKGRALGYEGLNIAVKRRTKSALGQAINLHLFRDCAATTLAVHDPVHVTSAKDILGHSDFRITERRYNQAQSLEASRGYNRILEGVRSEMSIRRHPISRNHRR